MKKIATIFLAGALLMACCAGCRRMQPEESSNPTNNSSIPTSNTTVPSTTNQGNNQTQSVELLLKIWQQYKDEDRFSAYGGTVENAVDDGPGGLNMDNVDELTNRYLIPQSRLGNVQEAASLVHMMNSNIFTAVAVKLSENVDRKTFYEDWRNAIQSNQWICGQPDRMVMVGVGDSSLIMAFGSTDAINAFMDNLQKVHQGAQVFYNEAIVS